MHFRQKFDRANFKLKCCFCQYSFIHIFTHFFPNKLLYIFHVFQYTIVEFFFSLAAHVYFFTLLSHSNYYVHHC